jgi:hypothetical protein
MLKKLVLLGLVLAAFIVPTSSITQAQASSYHARYYPKGIIMDMVAGIRIEVTDIPIAGATTTDGVIGIATPEAAWR